MYGMKQAPNVWAAYLNGWLDSKGFIRSKADPCVYTRRTKKGYKPGSSSASSSKITAKSPASADSIATDPSRGNEPSNGTDIEYDNLSLLVYVDDLAYHGSSAEAIQQFESEFQEKFGDIGCHFPSLYLGANITQDAVGLHISNRAMIERMRDQYFPSKDGAKVKVNVYRSPTPFPSNGSALGGEVLLKDCPDVANGEPPITAPFSELVGALAYCALTCRPDPGPITWCSRIHKERRTLSSMEAELVAVTEAAKDLLHITYVANDLNIDVQKGVPLFEDNQSVLALCLRTGITKRSKHIEVRWFLLRELQGPMATPGHGVLRLFYKNTKQQVADIFTKSTSEQIFTTLRGYLVREPDDQSELPADLGQPTTTA
jgi:hypothetical protein